MTFLGETCGFIIETYYKHSNEITLIVQKILKDDIN